MTTDVFKFNESALFAKIRERLPTNRTFTQNLLECCDDMLYVWDSKDSCLLTLNWRATLANGISTVPYQTLIPSTSQRFDVERLLIIEGSSQIVLIGRRGVALLELPRRWGKFSLFMDGKPRMTCNCTNLDTSYLNTNPKVEVRQVRWHNFTVTEANLLVLYSDNTIRVYEDLILRHIWRVGPIPTKYDLNTTDLTIPSGYDLGESVIDFDICPPLIQKSTDSNNTSTGVENNSSFQRTFTASRNSINQSLLSSLSSSRGGRIKPQSEINGRCTVTEKMRWPIILLRENGNIYILMVNADNSKPRLQGPLTIIPQSPNNYGLESCSILVIETVPLTLVIAETVGKLHHAVLIESDEPENTLSDMDTSLSIYPSEYFLFVVETIKLELGITNELPSTNVYRSAIHLRKDLISELRYFAYHNAGLHAISVNFIKELQRFRETKHGDDLNLFGSPSNAEYILCTKVNSGEGVNVVLGFVLLQLPAGLTVLLGSGQVITLKLVIESLFLLDAPKKSNETDIQEQKVDVDEYEGNLTDDIKRLLVRDVTQPLFSLDSSKNEPISVDYYAILLQSSDVFRSQYFKRFEAARAELIKRSNATELRKQQQVEEIQQLEKKIADVRDNAHSIAERFEELQEKQEILTKQCQDIMRQVNTQLPCNSMAQIEFSENVEQMKRQAQNMEATIQKVRETIKRNKYHIDKYNDSHENKKIELPEKQSRNIKEILIDVSNEIEDQIKQIKKMNKFVGI